MNGVKLTENAALEGLLKLHSIIEAPRKTNKKSLAEKTGLPLSKISVLTQQDIVAYKPVKRGNGTGRAFAWSWTGHRPNMHMAKKLVDSQPEFPYKTTTQAPPEEKVKEVVSAGLRSSVSIERSITITKKLDGRHAQITIKDCGGGLAELVTPIEEDGYHIDTLKCMGYAFLTAAEEMVKSGE